MAVATKVMFSEAKFAVKMCLLCVLTWGLGTNVFILAVMRSHTNAQCELKAALVATSYEQCRHSQSVFFTVRENLYTSD